MFPELALFLVGRVPLLKYTRKSTTAGNYPYSNRSTGGPNVGSWTAVGNGIHFCDKTRKASQRLTHHITGEIPLYHRSGVTPLDPTTLFLEGCKR